MSPPSGHDLLAFIDDLKRWTRQRTDDPHLAEDIVQETLVQALARLHEVREPEKLGGWLFRIAERRFIDSYRRMRVAEQPLLNDPAIPAPIETLREPLRIQNLRVAVRRLPPSLRRAVRLHSLEGWSIADVAGALDTTVAGVKSRLYRARRRMRGARL